MKLVEITVYLGKSYNGPNEYICSVEVKHPYIPSGDNIEGGCNLNHFKTVYKAGTYVADILDILDRFELDTYKHLKAKIKYDGNKSAVLYGKEILDFIDRYKNRGTL